MDKCTLKVTLIIFWLFAIVIESFSTPSLLICPTSQLFLPLRFPGTFNQNMIFKWRSASIHLAIRLARCLIPSNTHAKWLFSKQNLSFFYEIFTYKTFWESTKLMLLWSKLEELHLNCFSPQEMYKFRQNRPNLSLERTTQKRCLRYR